MAANKLERNRIVLSTAHVDFVVAEDTTCGVISDVPFNSIVNYQLMCVYLRPRMISQSLRCKMASGYSGDVII